MTFTPFDPALTLDRDYIRLHIGDTELDFGPRPLATARNFQDETILAMQTEEGGRKVATVAAFFEILAGEWARYNTSESEGDVSNDAKGLPDFYLSLADDWRKKPGGADLSGQTKTGYRDLSRIDAYNV